MQPNSAEDDLYAGLRQAEHTLPTSAYLDQAEYQRDLDAIWYRRWLMVCRAADIAEPLAYRVFTIGTQEVLVVRDETGSLRAFHNTCRHRGSQLCQSESGRLKARLLTCPYHSWSYSLRGDLVRVPSKTLPEGFLKSDYPLYSVALTEWRGFVFVNLDENVKGTVEGTFDAGATDMSNWPLEDLVSGHVFTKVMNCNWKIFWENFNECLHCPGVHKHLSQLVPIYGRGLMARHDDPEWQSHAAVQQLHEDPDPGAATASVCGRAVGQESGENPVGVTHRHLLLTGHDRRPARWWSAARRPVDR